MANIGNLAFKISAVADGALKTLQATGGAVSSFASKAAGGLGAAGGKIEGFLAKTNLGGWASSAMSGLKGVLGGLPGILMAGLGAAPDIISSQIENIKKLAMTGMKA